ncbi:MAG: ABC transporter ATP-binding protein, partial [Acidobacteria bacterium]|nr:ABC transporter ATP-binding protein [Acidobacteriota bacterium]
CGKTTLLNIISGLITPSEGRVLFNGDDVTHRPTAERNIAQVFQFPVIYDTMTVAQNLAFPLRNRNVPNVEVEKRVAEVARMLDLTPIMGKRARGLTADVKQKVSLGRGLVRPDVNAILFDEPLTVIDPHLKWQLRSKLKELHRQLNLTMVYVTHDQTEALTFADKVVVMYEGEVVQIGTPEELFERPAHTFVGYFIGSPGMNVAPVALTGNRARLGTQEIPLAQSYGGLPSGAKIELGIRPEFIRVSSNGRGVAGRVLRVDDVGRYRVVKLDLDGHAFSAIASEDAEIGGDRANVVLDPRNIHIYADGRLVEGKPLAAGAA